MPLKTRLHDDLTTAIKARDELRTATLRNTLFLPSLSMPSSKLPAVQNFFSVVLAWLSRRACSQYLVKKMYQVPSDMIARSPSTPFDTKSPIIQTPPDSFC